jgi:hypothetical protein
LCEERGSRERRRKRKRKRIEGGKLTGEVD